MFELDQVSVRYGALNALAPVDLSIAEGETLVLLGPSGSGKSTLLRTLAGLTPFTGEARFNGSPVSNWQQFRLSLGYVIQDGGLFPHLTARGNVTLMAQQLRWPPETIAARIEELAALTGIEPDQLDRFPAALSGGQRQRMALMRALMLDPHVLLLDEPLSALDPITRVRLARELREIFIRLGKTVVMVTHSLGEARFFTEGRAKARAVLMRDGRIVQQGSIADMTDHPADTFVSEFLEAEQAL